MGNVIPFRRKIDVECNDTASKVVLRPAAAFYADRNGHYSFVNQDWSQLTGIEQAQASGEGWLQSVHPDDRAEVALQWHEAVGREGFCNLEYRVLTPSQQLIWVLCQAMPQYDMDGAFIGYGGMLFNMTAYGNSALPLAALPVFATTNTAEPST